MVPTISEIVNQERVDYVIHQYFTTGKYFLEPHKMPSEAIQPFQTLNRKEIDDFVMEKLFESRKKCRFGPDNNVELTWKGWKWLSTRSERRAWKKPADVAQKDIDSLRETVRKREEEIYSKYLSVRGAVTWVDLDAAGTKYMLDLSDEIGERMREADRLIFFDRAWNGAIKRLVWPLSFSSESYL